MIARLPSRAKRGVSSLRAGENVSAFQNALARYPAPMRYPAVILISLWACLFGTVSAADLRVLTSLPPSVSEPYVDLFTSRTENGAAQVLNKNTIAGIDEILRGNERGFDVFWASSPEAFEILSRSDAFADDDVCGPDGPPPVAAFALSSVGWARRTDSDLFMPAEWNDLTRPLYRNRLAMARPARSGSTHMLIEQLLQVRGWQDGWAFILGMSANLSTLTARSFGVPDGLVNDRFDIGLTIDFLSQANSAFLRFQYGRPLVVAPAQIGILRNGRDPDAACAFLSAVLSREGQLTLLSPGISRVPYNPDIRAEVKDRLPTEIVDALKLTWFEYDAETSADRYWAVNTLFDLMIAEQLDRRRTLWRMHHDLKPYAPAAYLDRVHELLTTVVATEDEATLATGADAGLRNTSLIRMDPHMRSLAEDWRARVITQLEDAERALLDLQQRYLP